MSTETFDQEKITLVNLSKVGGVSILLATIVNIILFYIGDAIDAYNVQIETPSGSTTDFTVVAVISSMITFGLIGLIGFYVLTKILNLPINQVRIISIIAVIFTFALPFGLKDASTEFLLILESMHVVAGLFIVGGLTTSRLWDKLT